MPSSSTFGKVFCAALVKALFKRTELTKALDIGPGDGTYARILRKSGLNPALTAIEVWGPYIKDYKLRSIYNEVICGDARYIDYAAIGQFQLALAGDVLEHMSFSNGQRLVERVLRSSDVLIASVPICHAEQGDEFGNPYEVHVEEDYTPDMIRELSAFHVYTYTKSYIGVGVFCSNERSRSIISKCCAAAAASASGIEDGIKDFDYAELERVLSQGIES